MKNRHSQTMKVPILIDFIYFFNIKTKANPSPKGNGFAFNLFGEPNVNYPNSILPVGDGFGFIIKL